MRSPGLGGSKFPKRGSTFGPMKAENAQERKWNVRNAQLSLV